MSNQEYLNNKPIPSFIDPRFAPRSNINFNYVWDSVSNEWIPMFQDGGRQGTRDSVLANAKSFIHKFGCNPNVKQDANSSDKSYTIWDGESSYIFPNDLGESIDIVSSNSSDGQEIVIQGLDEVFNFKEVSATLNGTTPVNIAGLFSRIFRVYNNGSENLEGDVYVVKNGTWTNVNNITNLYAKIISHNNQTLMSVYSIPADSVGYLLKYKLSAQNPSSSSVIGYTIDIKVRQKDKIFRVLTRASVGTDHSLSEEFPFPIKLEPKSDIIFNIISANGNNGSVNGTFDIALV